MKIFSHDEQSDLEHNGEKHTRINRVNREKAEVEKNTFNREQIKTLLCKPKLVDQGAIQGGVVDTLLQLGGKLIGGIVSQQQGKNPTKQVGGNLLNGIVGNNPTKQLGNQLLNGLVGNQQQKPVNVQVTQKPQVGETWSGFPTYFFGDTLQVA